jgi:hypothetical protein
MKNITTVIILIVLLSLCLHFAPWYFSVVILFGAGFIRNNKKLLNAFLTGFLSTFITWIALYLMKDIPNGSLLSSRIAEIFFVGNQYLLFSIAGVLFGICGGFGYFSGVTLRKVI